MRFRVEIIKNDKDEFRSIRCDCHGYTPDFYIKISGLNYGEESLIVCKRGFRTLKTLKLPKIADRRRYNSLEFMKDPTYIKEEIEANTEYYIAWILSEIYNDNAPLGWDRYRTTARELLRVFDIKKK